MAFTGFKMQNGFRFVLSGHINLTKTTQTSTGQHETVVRERDCLFKT